MHTFTTILDIKIRTTESSIILARITVITGMSRSQIAPSICPIWQFDQWEPIAPGSNSFWTFLFVIFCYIIFSFPSLLLTRFAVFLVSPFAYFLFSLFSWFPFFKLPPRKKIYYERVPGEPIKFSNLERILLIPLAPLIFHLEFESMNRRMKRKTLLISN